MDAIAAQFATRPEARNELSQLQRRLSEAKTRLATSQAAD
jgi:hypothetical protein